MIDDTDLAYALIVNKWNELIKDFADKKPNEIWDEMEEFTQRYKAHEGKEFLSILPDCEKMFHCFAAGMAYMLTVAVDLETMKEDNP